MGERVVQWTKGVSGTRVDLPSHTNHTSEVGGGGVGFGSSPRSRAYQYYCRGHGSSTVGVLDLPRTVLHFRISHKELTYSVIVVKITEGLER